MDLDAHVALIDQEPNDQGSDLTVCQTVFGRSTAGSFSPQIHLTGYFDSQTMSLSLYDGSFYSGILDSNIVTFPDSGDWVGLDWVGQITKPKIEDCFQNKLDEYCRNLGVKDNFPVEGEEGF